MEEAAAELVKLFPLCSTQKLDSTDSQITTIQSDLPYDESCTTLCLEVTSDDSTTPTCMILTKNLNKDASSVTLCNDYLALSSEGKLTEYFQSSDDNNETKSNIPSLVVSSLELGSREFLYCNHDTSVSNSQMLIIDTDLQCNQEFCHESGHDSSPSPEMFFKDTGQNVMYDDRDGSDVLSAISNEECSVCSEILDHKSFHAPQNSDGEDVNGHIGHIDSPETSDTTCPNSEPLHGESIMDDMSSVLGHDLVIAMAGKNDEDVVENTYTDDTTLFTVSEMPVDQGNKCQTDTKEATEGTQFGFENRAFGIDNRCDDQKVCEPVRYCSLAQFVEGNDIARRSFKKHMRPNKKVDKNDQNRQSLINEENECPDTIKIQIQGSNHDLAGITSEVVYDKEDSRLISSPLHSNAMFPQVCVIVEPPSPIVSEELRNRRMRQAQGNIGDTPNIKSKLLGHLSGTPFPDRRSSDHNPNLLGLDSEHMKFLSCSPAATRRISSGSLFKGNESAVLATSAASLYGSSSNGLGMSGSHRDDRDDASKRLPIINPLVQLPTWPNVSSGAGFISKCLLANADALCAAVSPLMDPDETLLEGYYEKSVMNNYFGIGIDAKISLDFHHKREEHPEKCRSRAKNYMWYGVLGSKQWLQKTYKNLEQRVQLECDGQRIPLPSLQGIVILNIPSFMGGTNFWGGTKEDDCFLAPSFDDRILEVVAVFGSVQMAASRLINLQHHRIAQCQTVQINILGDEGVPIQVDGEAWLQPPGMIRIIHKNRMQMLCRNRALETSLRAWEEKQRAHSISREHSSTTAGHLVVGGAMDTFSEQESYLLLNFIECASTLVKWVKFLTISHPSLEADLYSVAAHTASCLESIHPNGKIVEGHDLREHLTELVSSARQLYEETCVLLRDKAHHLTLREDLETKLSASLANMEGELRRCVIEGATGTPGGHAGLVYLHAVPPDESERKHRKGLFWLKFRGGKSSGGKSCSRDVASWGVQEVATWLEAMQLGEYVDSFTRNDVRGKELLTLARRDLKDLSVTKVGHVKRILQAVKDLSG